MGLYLFVSAVYGHMAEAAGVEPTTTESKSVVLPLHHASISGIKRATYLSYSLCFEPLRGTPFRFRFVIPYC